VARDESESGISTIKVGGGGELNLTNNDTDIYDDYSPDHSPSGRKIVFMIYNEPDDEAWLSTIEVGGGNETQITAPKYRGFDYPS
jgi:hypothetical protein